MPHYLVGQMCYAILAEICELSTKLVFRCDGAN